MQNQNDLDQLINSLAKNVGHSSETEQKSPAKEATAELPRPVQKTETQKEKMAKIRAALAKANAEESAAETAELPLPKILKDSEAAKTVQSSDSQDLPAPPKPKPSAQDVQVRTEPPLPEEPVTEDAADEEDEYDDVDYDYDDEEEEELAAVSKAAAKPKKTSGGAFITNEGVSMHLFAGLTGAALALALTASYFLVAGTYQGKFLPNTYVNAVKVSGMGLDEAEDTLIDSAGVCEVTFVTPKGEEVVFSADDFMGKYFIPSGALSDAAAESSYNWVGKLFSHTDYEVDYDFVYSQSALRQLVESYDWGKDVSEDAQVVLNDDGSFSIEPETLGDRFDMGILLDYTAEQLKNGNTTIQMEDSGCYESYRADVTKEDLESQLDIYENISKCSITYDFSDRKKVVTSKMILDWLAKDNSGHIIMDMDGQVAFDRTKVIDFVTEMADETDTYGKDRQFQSTMDGLITITWDGNYSSIYGWQINKEATVEQLIDLMQAGESVTVEPEYTQRGFCRDTNDIGDTYIDVDISEQHFWFYKNGKIIMDNDFVSGTETRSDRRTPRGIGCIWTKSEDTILGTYEIQGYEQFVDFWMPFNKLGCGFHDLSRGAYGGTIYMYNGSHGCLNLKWSVAEELYQNVEVGTPVLVHD